MTVLTMVLIYLVGNAALNMCWIYINMSFAGQGRQFWKMSGTFLLWPQHYLIPIWLIYGCMTVVVLLRLVALLIRWFLSSL